MVVSRSTAYFANYSFTGQCQKLWHFKISVLNTLSISPNRRRCTYKHNNNNNNTYWLQVDGAKEMEKYSFSDFMRSWTILPHSIIFTRHNSSSTTLNTYKQSTGNGNDRYCIWITMATTINSTFFVSNVIQIQWRTIDFRTLIRIWEHALPMGQRQHSYHIRYEGGIGRREWKIVISKWEIYRRINVWRTARHTHIAQHLNALRTIKDDYFCSSPLPFGIRIVIETKHSQWCRQTNTSKLSNLIVASYSSEYEWLNQLLCCSVLMLDARERACNKQNAWT